jgi:organic radical activating enzyme
MDTDIKELQQVKNDLDNGIKHKHCNYCWREEELGNKSWRQVGNEMPDNRTRNVEIYLDNTCDLACVYCTPKYSSSWIQEINHAHSQNVPIENFMNYDPFEKEKVKYDHLPKILEYIEELGRTAATEKPIYINFLGGEPLLTSAIKKDVIASIIQAYYKTAGADQYLGIQIVTNCNTPDAIIDKTLERLDELVKIHKNLEVNVNISMESLEKNAEFIRYGLEWDHFVKNLNKWMSKPYVYTFGFSMCVNVLSWRDTPNFIEWAFNQARKNNQTAHLQFNSADFPRHLSLKMLPTSEKHLFEKIEQNIIKNRDNYTNENLFMRNLIQVDQAKNDFGKTANNRAEIKKILDYIDYIKKYRKKDIPEINKDLYEHFLHEYQRE